MLARGDVGRMIGQDQDSPFGKGAEFLQHRADDVVVDVLDRVDFGFPVGLMRGFVRGFDVGEDQIVIDRARRPSPGPGRRSWCRGSWSCLPLRCTSQPSSTARPRSRSTPVIMQPVLTPKRSANFGMFGAWPWPQSQTCVAGLWPVSRRTWLIS